MSWGSCNSGCNNIHFNYPPSMNDSRLFSDYNSAPSLDNSIKQKSNITTNSDYRKYLQTNADNIIKNNQLSACNECSTCPYIHNSNKHALLEESNHPYIFKTILSNDQPFGYENSDLKNVYLTRQQLDAQKHAPRYTIKNPA